LHNRREGLLGHPARLQEPREVAALTQLRDAQLDGIEWEMYILAFNHFLMRPTERGAANAIARMFHPIADRGKPIEVQRPGWRKIAARRRRERALAAAQPEPPAQPAAA
jgi:hypothetical protein